MAVTPNYSWPIPVATDLVKDGYAAIADLGDAIDATVFGLGASGLALVSTTTIGTAVSSVTISSAFSATYDNYIVILSGGTCSVTNSIFTLQLGASTTTYSWAQVGLLYSGATTSNTSGNSTSSFGRIGSHHTNGLQMACTLVSPFLSKYTFITSDVICTDFAGHTMGVHATAASYTSFILTPASGTLTGGTIKVYGYKN